MDDSLQPDEVISDLSARIKVKRGFFTKDWVDVKVYEFCPSSCIIKTDEVYLVGSPITLSFKLPLELNEIVIEELVGKVTSKRKDCSCFHYCVEINISKMRKDSLVSDKIKQIDSIIRKKRALTTKLNSVARQ